MQSITQFTNNDYEEIIKTFSWLKMLYTIQNEQLFTMKKKNDYLNHKVDKLESIVSSFGKCTITKEEMKEMLKEGFEKVGASGTVCAEYTTEDEIIFTKDAADKIALSAVLECAIAQDKGCYVFSVQSKLGNKGAIAASRALKPDFVIPFKLDKKAAIEALKKHYFGKKLLPKVFQDENRIKEVKGIYVPFWLFGADADGYVRYKATRIRSWSDSNYRYTETSYYTVVRAGEIGFENVPVDGSTKIDDALMESIEPFDISEAVDYNSAYLAGFFADKYDVDAESSIERANERIKQATRDAFADTVHGYTTVTPISTNISLSGGKAKYALYPVWMLTTQWNGKTYTFAMNAQTGKLVGDLPMDKALYRKWLFGVAGAVSTAVFALSYLLWML